MPINPEIALGVKQFEMPDPLTAYAKVAAIKDAQNRNALSQLEFAKARREEATTNALNEVYRASVNPETGEVDYGGAINKLAQGGFGSSIPALEEFRFKNKTAATNAAKADEELFTTKLASARRALDFFNPNDPNAPQQYEDYLHALYSDKILGPRLTAMGAPIEKSLAALNSAVQTGTFPEFLQQSVVGAEKVLQNRMEQSKPTDFDRKLTAAGIDPKSPEGRQIAAAALRKDIYIAPTETGQPPADVRTVQWLMTQPEEVQNMYFQMFGKGQMTPYQSANLEIEQAKENRIAAEDKAKKEAAARAVEATAAGAEESARIVTDAIAKAKKLVSPTSTGFGSLLSGIPTSDARALEGQLNVVKANLGFDRLRQMREESKTGGALGSIAVKELERLEAAVATLDTGLKDKQLIDALDAVSTHYNNWLAERQKLTKKTDGAPAGGAPTERQPLGSFD